MSLLQGASKAVGLSVPVLQFLLAFIATLPLSWGWRLLPKDSHLARHFYAAITGALVSYYALPPDSHLLLLVPITISYTSMLFCRRHCGLLTFLLAFVFLLACHVHFMSGESWKKGGIDATGALMVLTLKVISAAMNYQDGLLKEAEVNLRPLQKRNRICALPGPVAYLGYCLNCGNHLAGPVFELRDYIDWTENQGIWSFERPPQYVFPTLKAMARSLLSMGLYMCLRHHFTHPITHFYDLSPLSGTHPWPLWRRFGQLWMCGFTERLKFYFIWSISEASLILSGGLGQLLATQVVSALWHGLYIGYFLFFVHSALMIAGARIIYKWQLWMNSKLDTSLQSCQFRKGLGWRMTMLRTWKQAFGWVVGYSYASIVLHYSWAGFLLLNMKDTLLAYQSLYYVGTILPLLALSFGQGMVGKYPIKPRVIEKIA